MDRRHLQLVLRHAASVGCPAEPDALLLKRYATERDEIAFAELVRRHGRLVWALCRNLLPSEADADDAFQATFLALAKSASTIRDAGRLGPWLHGVAYRVCLKAKREAARRKRRQEAAATKEATRPVADSAWDAALAAVHEEVHRLPEPQRVAFVLCILEGKGATEAAEQLGWKLGTLSGRLTRAKEAIIARLAARGIAAAVVGAAAISGGASAAVPTAVVTRAAELIADGAVVPSSILSLSQGVVGMAIHRTKVLAALVLMGGLLTVGSGWLANAGAQQPEVVGEVRALYDYAELTTPVAKSEFCYYVPKGPLTVAQFEAAVAKYAAHFKAEFVSTARMNTAEISQFGSRVVADDWKGIVAKPAIVEALVFKRTVPPKAEVVLRDDVVLGREAILNIELAQSIRPTMRLDPNPKIQEIETQIQKLQAQLNELRKKSLTTVNVTKADLGMDPSEVMTILHTLAAKRFGKDARERLSLSAGTNALTISGDAEIVQWAQDMVKKLTEK